MVKITIDAPDGVIDTTASPQEFVMTVIAHNIRKQVAIDDLLGKSVYAERIEPMEHQSRTALTVLNNFSHRALLADEVGLGKTIETGMILKEYILRKIAKKILILTPAPLKYQWQQEMKDKFSENFHIADNPQDYNVHDEVIASLDTAKTPRHAKVAREVVWDLVVVDEAHKLKNSATQNYKFVKSLTKERFLMLTATPLQNNLYELWALIDLLHPGFLGTRSQFKKEFVADTQGLQLANRDELRAKLSKIMIRNLRGDTDVNFPDRNVTSTLLEYSKPEMDFYTEVIRFIRREYIELKKVEKPADVQTDNLTEEELSQMADKYRQKGLLTFSLIMLTRQVASSIQTGVKALRRYRDTLEDDAKARGLDHIIRLGQLISTDPKLDHILKLLKKTKEKVIIFTTFVHTQKIIQLELSLAGISSVIFNGQMTPEEKERAIIDFRDDKQVLICTDAGSEGRNLQFAHILINYDLPWNPMRIEQRIGRVHRIGQKYDVVIHNLAIKDTIEAYILNRLYEKIRLFTFSVGEMDMILSELKTSNVERTMFESYLEGDESNLVQDFQSASTRLKSIKDFDSQIFDENGSRTH